MIMGSESFLTYINNRTESFLDLHIQPYEEII